MTANLSRLLLWSMLVVGSMGLGADILSRLRRDLEADKHDDVPTTYTDMNYTHLENILKHGLLPASQPKNVIIVGAGFAGLSAGYVLKKAGHKVTIFEADNRIGGRVLTHRAPNNEWYAELGAMRIPSNHTLMMSFLKKFNITTNKFIMDDPNTWVMANDIRLQTKQYDKHPDSLKYNTQGKEKGKTADELFEMALKPVSDELDKYGWDYIVQKYDKLSVLQFLEQSGLSAGAIEMIGVLSNAEGLFYTAFTEFIRDQTTINDKTEFFEITNGTDLILQPFIKELEKNIVLESTVTDISHTDDFVVVKVQETNNVAGAKKTYTADYVLITTTAPATLAIRFTPSLSSEKQAALRQVHYDASTKIFLVFNESFYEDQKIHGGKSITDQKTRFTYYPSHSFRKGGAVLASYTWSDDATKWTGDNDTCKQEALEILSKIHNNATIKDLYVGGIIKRWHQDPFAKGAFALFTPGQETRISSDLAQPEGRLYFAGEHTTLNHAWLEGSLASGLQAASQISEEVFDILVIGGGPIGLATAYYAAKKDPSKRIAILEADTFANNLGSSAGYSRQYREMYETPSMAQKAIYSGLMYERLETETHSKLLHRTGYLYFGDVNTGDTNEGDMKGINRTCTDLQMGCGYLNSTQIQKEMGFNNISKGWKGLFRKDGGVVDVQATLTTLKKQIDLMNVSYYENTKAKNICTNYDYVRVRTDKSFLQAQKVVITVGAYANRLYDVLGFQINHVIQELPSFYFKENKNNSNVAWFAFGGDTQNLYYGFPNVSWDRPGYQRVCPDVSQNDMQDPSGRNGTPSEELFDKTKEFVKKHMPYLDPDQYIIENTTCLINHLYDNGYVLDFAPPSVDNNRNIILFTAGWAFKFVPLFGKILSELALDGDTTHDITEFSIMRPGILKSNKPAPTPEDQLIPIVVAAVLCIILVIVLVVIIARCYQEHRTQRMQGYHEIGRDEDA